ncbi:type II toxin-antitoxin system RelE/ParE family toxin [Methylobacterium sp. SD21]|uniref:type II toxin-antitoxin system RelE family toxin n=1 Tax=Methylobacterium litchii TaxID=3138810 RepID=UPI00313BCFAE
MPQVVYSRDAIRTLSRMPANISRLIRSKIEHYAADPSALANNVKMLKGEPGVVRLRMGDWRVLFTEDGVVIAVICIATRGSVYDR